MFCDKCGTELADNATFCSNCGNRVKAEGKPKNIYVALILTFILSGLGSIYAGNVKKGVIILAVRLATAFLSVFSNIFPALSMLVWAYAFYEAYKDVQIANGHSNPKLIDDFKGWDQNNKIIAVLIIVIILTCTAFGCIGSLAMNYYVPDDSDTHYYVSDSGSGYGSSSSSSSGHSHYGGVDDSPRTIAKNDPDWYYEHYEYGDNQDIDDYLESEGYD